MGSMVEAVQRDLDQIAERDEDLASSALAHLALAMAGEIDDQGNSATSKSMCAARLSDALERLRELAPPKEKVDRLDEVKQKREQRRGRRRSAEA